MKQEILDVARALRESVAPAHFFDMKKWGYPVVNGFFDKVLGKEHTCGTPACALGHYAVRKDLQSVFDLNLMGELLVNGRVRPLDWSLLAAPFDITDDEARKLFGPKGCDNAQTREQAATYLEAFAERKWPTVVQAAIAAPKPVKVEEREVVCV